MRRGLNDSARETLHLFRKGKTIPEIARSRGITEGTTYGHLEDAILAGEMIDVNALVSPQAQHDIAAAFTRHGSDRLGVRLLEALGGKYTYGECKIVRAALQSKLRSP